MKLDFIDSAKIHDLLDWPYLVHSFRMSHCDARPIIGRLALESPHSDRQSDVMIAAPAWIPGKDLGCKLITSFPENVAQRGLPTVNSIYATFNPETGEPCAILDGEALIFRKTAATSALGADILAPQKAKRMLMLGAGALAPYAIAAMRAVRPDLEELRIWNRTPEKAEHLAKQIGDITFEATALDDYESSLGWADIVVAATMSETPLVFGDSLQEGAHVNLIGSFTPTMREGDDALLTRAHLYMDHRDIAARNGEFHAALASGLISENDFRGDLFDLCQDVMPDPGPVTMFKNGGAAHLDLFTARAVMARYS